MISASGFLFQTATNGFRALTASAVVIKFIRNPLRYSGQLKDAGVALAELTVTFNAIRELPFEKEIRKPHNDKNREYYYETINNFRATA